MAIKEIKGNLIGLCETGVLDGMVHGCNCLHAMGSGIAGQLARRYPIVPAADRKNTTCGDMSKLGYFTEVCVASVVQHDTYFNVFNLYTQKTPTYNGDDVFDYASFPEGLERIKRDILVYGNAFTDEDDFQTEHPYKLGFPKIGTGLAGGDWIRIKEMIVNAFADCNDIEIYLVDWDGSDLPEPTIEDNNDDFEAESISQ